MFICADIGGTSARLQLLDEESLRKRSTPIFRKTYSTETVPSFVDLFRIFVAESTCDVPVKAVVCGIPGDVIKNCVEPMNIPQWGIVDGNDLITHGLADACVILNDFECAGFSLNALSSDDVNQLREGREQAGSTKVMVGLGTGLGVTFATQTDGHYVPCSSEAGWMSFSPITEIDNNLVTFLKSRNGWNSVGFEQVCSGRGLCTLHQFAMEREGLAYVFKTPYELCSQFQSCSSSRFAIQLVLEYLGRFLSQIGIIFKPTGGIFLCGGLMDSLRYIIKDDESFTRGLQSQPAPILSDISEAAPIYYINVPDVGLCGAIECCIALNKINH